MHFIKKPVYKARTPEETIRIIRDIMYEGDIFLCESNYYHKASGTSAATLWFGDEAFVGSKYITNGKGMNSRYALASAYGEMMERFEAGLFCWAERKRAYKEKKVRYLCAPDEKQIPFKALPFEAVQSIKMLLHLSDEAYEDAFKGIQDTPVFCVPYEDAIQGNKVYLPIELYMYLCSSNGLCAGNTRNEALAQGISELFERASLTNIYYKNTCLKKLPDVCFEGNDVLEKLKYLESQGYTHKIIDASMDLGYPVMGLVLEKDGSIMFDLGADPNPVVALERCLTELFQSAEDSYELRLCNKSCGLYSDWQFPIQKRWYHGQFTRARVLGTGLKPDNLFNIPDEYSTHYVYNESGLEDYEYLLGLIKKLGYHLYIRDLSYLGFPAYHAMIPEISLADFDIETFPEKAALYLSGVTAKPKFTEAQYEGLLPILNFVEKKQEAYYGVSVNE